MEAENVYLTDIIDLDVLQKIQDAFSSMTDMACIITDAYGVAVTNGSNFCDFCSRFTRVSPEGARRCEECDRRGAEMAIENKGVCTYFCHAGLIEFAAPIMANGQMVGSMVGGQILSSPPDLNAFAEKANELGIDPDDYTHEAKKVRILAQEEIDKAALSLNSLAEVLSTVATNNFNMLANSAEVEKSAKLKSDFLANMSHEIRTPMNAVLGMAEMALREEMSPTARDFIHQIRASGKNLLTIINDILDFSKIESGKMEIIEVPYEPLSMINDIASMVNSRIGDKNIEFTVDAPPEIPHKLFGDNVRIQQILINLLTNAVKFTKQGQVQLRLKFRKKNENEGTLKALVMDTGMGIKEENLDKIFESFQQVDSKRNRNIEGTGLGLAITQQLLTLMGGFIDVESEYNVGSTFAIIIPQKIVSKEPSVPKADKTISAAVISQNMYICMQLVKDLSRLNATYTVLEKENYMDSLDFDFLFIEENLFTKEIQTFVTNNPKLQCVVIENRKSLKRFNVVNIRTIRKPIYVLSLYSILGIGEDYAAFADFMDDDFPFTAPEAQILIVDDNTINLTVAEGLLEPLNMKIDTATGAKDAINKIKEKKFDLIFMDHMMPEIDGVEATHMIRTTFPDYEDTPIIALTANAVANAKDMFLSEGLNDFVAKPIEIKDIVSKLKKWLPHEKIVIAESQHEEKQEDELGPFYKEVEVESETYPDGTYAETAETGNAAEEQSAFDASPDPVQETPEVQPAAAPASQSTPAPAPQSTPAQPVPQSAPAPASQSVPAHPAPQSAPAPAPQSTPAQPAPQPASAPAPQSTPAQPAPQPAAPQATAAPTAQSAPAPQQAPSHPAPAPANPAPQPAPQSAPAPAAPPPAPKPAPPKPAAPGQRSGPLEIEGLNVKLALSLLGTEKLFLTVLKQYFCAIEQKARSIENHYNNEDWKNYTIEVHALKSTSKQIGAEHVSAVAAELEKAGNEGNIDLIREKNAGMLAEYRGYRKSLKYLFPDVPDEDEEKEADSGQINEQLDKLAEAIEDFDSLTMEEVVENLSKFKLTGEGKSVFDELKEAVSSSELEKCSELIAKWKGLLG